MITAFVFVHADVDRIPQIADTIASLDHVVEVYSVTGELDLIALVQVTNYEDIAVVIADHLNKVPGVIATETHLAFRTYSGRDLDAAFSLGDGD